MLILSLFPGIGLLDQAFEEEGFCVVRGPDLLWGGDIRGFHPPAGKFDGVIGGPPCPAHSHLGNVVARAAGDSVAADLIPEFSRCVAEAAPMWFLMENVPAAPPPAAPSSNWRIRKYKVDNRLDCGGEQRRKRVFYWGSFGEKLDLGVDWWWRPTVPDKLVPTVTANATVWKNGRAHGEKSYRYLREVMLPAQGLPPDFLNESPFTLEGKIKVVGNGVPLPMGRKFARAIKEAMRKHYPVSRTQDVGLWVTTG